MTPDFHAQFREELLAAITRPPRGHPRLVAGGFAVVAMVVVGAITLLGPSPAHAVVVTRDNGRVEVLLTDLASSADEVQAAVSEAGLNVQVVPAPVGPSNVGRFVGNTTTGSGLEDIERIDGEGEAFMGFSIPEHWTGQLTILIGRPAHTGEHYAVFSDGYAPGEPLACSGTLGRPLRQAEERLANMTVTVRGPLGTGPAAVPLAEALRSEQADWGVTSAYAMSSDTLLITVSPTSPDAQEAPC